jgi:hypothetical protein
VAGRVNSHRLKVRLRLLGGPAGCPVPLLRGLWLPAVLLVVDHVLDGVQGCNETQRRALNHTVTASTPAFVRAFVSEIPLRVRALFTPCSVEWKCLTHSSMV